MNLFTYKLKLSGTFSPYLFLVLFLVISVILETRSNSCLSFLKRIVFWEGEGLKNARDFITVCAQTDIT